MQLWSWEISLPHFVPPLHCHSPLTAPAPAPLASWSPHKCTEHSWAWVSAGVIPSVRMLFPCTAMWPDWLHPAQALAHLMRTFRAPTSFSYRHIPHKPEPLHPACLILHSFLTLPCLSFLPPSTYSLWEQESFYLFWHPFPKCVEGVPKIAVDDINPLSVTPQLGTFPSQQVLVKMVSSWIHICQEEVVSFRDKEGIGALPPGTGFGPFWKSPIVTDRSCMSFYLLTSTQHSPLWLHVLL